MAKKLIISSNDVEDWNGVWFKGDVEQEMKDCNQTPKGKEWIEWVVDHMFDDDELQPEIAACIVEFDELKSVKLMLDCGEVMIKKV